MIVSGQRIVKELGGKGSYWHGGKGLCRCPAHDDADPSLSVAQTPDRVLVKCFAGCDQTTVLNALRAAGLWSDRDEFGLPARRRAPLRDPTPSIDTDEIANRDAARQIWAASGPLQRSAAALYLWSRGINMLRFPPTLRAAAALYNTESKKALPALIAAIQDGQNKVTAVQRIWVLDKLVTEGGVGPAKGTKAPLRIAKKTLGPMTDGAVRLGPASRTLGIAEGIETGLSAKAIYSLSVWVSCGAWRMGNIALPDIVQNVVIFGDTGTEGEKAASKAAEQFAAQGYAVDIEFPRDGFDDFNSQIVGMAA